jgi:hypothetical protein
MAGLASGENWRLRTFRLKKVPIAAVQGKIWLSQSVIIEAAEVCARGKSLKG